MFLMKKKVNAFLLEMPKKRFLCNTTKLKTRVFAHGLFFFKAKKISISVSNISTCDRTPEKFLALRQFFTFTGLDFFNLCT